MLNMATFGYTADIYTIIHFISHACQHITVGQSHSSGDTVAKILEIRWEWWHKDGTVSLTHPHKKKSQGIKSCAQGGHRCRGSGRP
jgi:hypothetical protein